MTRPIRTTTVGEGPDLITYDVHGNLAEATPERPVLLAVGSPMDAGGFLALAAQMADRPVVTLDPRGTGRNSRGTGTMTPQQHADDLHRVITDLDAGPVDLFATSGGAVNSLALAATHPEDLRRVVAHEPPLVTDLPDRDAVLAACRRLRQVYEESGHGQAMAGFIALVMHDGPVEAGLLDGPLPDPAAFGLPAEDDGSRDDALFRNMPACNELALDVPALTTLGDRLVIAVGEDSGQTLAARGGRAVAGVLGGEAVVVPGDHTGFAGPMLGMPGGKPEEFAARLRDLLG